MAWYFEDGDYEHVIKDGKKVKISDFGSAKMTGKLDVESFLKTLLQPHILNRI